MFSSVDQSAKEAGLKSRVRRFQSWSSSTSPSCNWSLSRVAFCCIFVFFLVCYQRVRCAVAHPQDGDSSAAACGVPMSSAHVRIGGESPLFLVSELESTWDNCGREREREDAEHHYHHHPPTTTRTSRPLIKARVPSVQVSTWIFCLDQQLWTWCSSGFKRGITVKPELFQVSALFLDGFIVLHNIRRCFISGVL